MSISWSTQTLSQTITPFVSTDAGASWAPLDVRPGAKQFAMLEHGGVLVATDIYDPRGQGSTAVHFSVDEGATWATASIPFARPVHIVGLYPEPGEATDKLTIFGYPPPKHRHPFPPIRYSSICLFSATFFLLIPGMPPSPHIFLRM